ncbi:periplasmic copper-binding protein [Halovivax asiaticus JCM 14624]|uniref:Periplasmic copper-binding protein n=1 Tax=Halovivax asiaticus JCM 14624 TaxID=1227490 RepID=M0BMC2_9EURY|nr:GLUG motif-containing protein [Halovivax asiaticus]ELZ11632.1 periplasmic copper-binding protein [Halovivax asiaticus JCM 14624]
MDDGLSISREGWLRLAVRVAALVALVAICGAGFAGVMADGATNQPTIEGMDGNGTADDPYVVTNATQLQAMEEDLDAHYVLGNDVDASNTAEWNDQKGFEPVGNESEPFTGALDGRGHTIDAFSINRSDENHVGLFGYTDHESVDENPIRTVTMTNATVVGNERVGTLVGAVYLRTDISDVDVHGTVTGTDRVGGVVGQHIFGSATDVSVNATVTGRNDVGGYGGFTQVDTYDMSVESTVDGENRVGGAFGTNIYPTSNVSVTTDVTGINDVGGIAGISPRGNSDTIEKSSVSGTVTGTTNVGGLIGKTRESVVDSSSSATVDGGQNVGGLVGNVAEDDGEFERSLRATVRNSTASGDVYGEQYVGGLVGVINGGDYSNGEWDHGLVTDSSATGDVYVVDAEWDVKEHVGGLVGIMRDSPDTDDSPRIQDSWASGSVGNEDGFPFTVGGLVGTVDAGTVARSSAIGDVNGEDTVGGLVGENAGTIVESRASGLIDGSYITGGIGANNRGTIARSSSTARVGGHSFSTGGLVADNQADGDVTDSWAAGRTSGPNSDNGGLIGYDQGTVSDSYWDVDATGQSDGIDNDPDNPGVTGRTTAEMTGPAAESNMTDLEFPGTWEPTNRYPHLSWQPSFDVAISETNAPVTAGENVTATVTVTNTGDMADAQAVWLTDTGFEDREQDLTQVALEPGESETVTLEWATEDDATGDHSVRATTPDATANATVEVREESDGGDIDPSPDPSLPSPSPPSDGTDRAELVVTEVSPSTTTVAVGDSVRLDWTVENRGDVAGERRIDVRVDGRTVAERSVELGAGESRTMNVTHAFETTGQYEFAVDGEAVDTVTVEDNESAGGGTGGDAADDGANGSSSDGSAADSPPGGDGDASPGYGPVGTLAALALLVALAARRSDRG